MLMMCLIHHIFDASWSVVIRRQWEHGLAAFKWLALLFVPLVLASFFYDPAVVWSWFDLTHELHALLRSRMAGFGAVARPHDRGGGRGGEGEQRRAGEYAQMVV